MTVFKKYKVTIEFRYTYKDYDYDEEYSTRHRNELITIGIYDELQDAIDSGNRMLINNLESRFELNKNWNVRERFSKNKDLVTNLAYLQTPFEFYAKVETLHYKDVSETIDNILKLKGI